MLKLHFSGKEIEAGCDEAGRGALAGPVFAAAVILPDSFSQQGLDDSKKLSRANREYYKDIIESQSITYNVANIDHNNIDEINILNASIKAMHLAIDGLSVKPCLLLIDGNRFKAYPGIPHHCIIKGDGLFASIAAASVLAKTYRDAYMIQLHNEFPMYAWNENKGYGTKKHVEAILKFGLSPYHRKSFQLKNQLKFNL